MRSIANLDVQESTALPKLVREYLLDCSARNLSAKTIKDNYRYPLERVLLPLCERHGIADPAGLDQHALNELSIELQQGTATP